MAREPTPPTALIRQDDTHRLIPARWGEENVLSVLADDEQSLFELSALESATNPRLAAETLGLPAISKELVFGVLYAAIINGCFTHPRAEGGRFNDFTRGAWYASFDAETAQMEVAHHRVLELQEIDWRKEEVSTYVEYLADFRADFHDLRKNGRFKACLDPDSYAHSQRLAGRLLQAGSAGVVYPSVRHSGGTCLACFRPQLVMNVRQAAGSTKMTFRNGSLVDVAVEKG